MAGTSLLALIDDIASILDDVSAMTKVATQKTAGVLGDDLALNAQQVTGVNPERELPVVWAVAKGSAINKLILVPAALSISALAPWGVIPLLAAGGLFLCYEGFEKILHKFLHSKRDHQKEIESKQHHLKALSDPTIDLVALEKDKIKGAVRTDFILSAEIIVITLGTVADKSLLLQLSVLLAISVIMTIGVYGLVACIVKMDDLGLYLSLKEGESSRRKTLRAVGRMILRLAPGLMRLLSILGTAAMFLVGGGIIVHAIPLVEHISHDLILYLTHLEGWYGSVLGGVSSMLINGIVGLISGAIVVALIKMLQLLRAQKIED